MSSGVTNLPKVAPPNAVQAVELTFINSGAVGYLQMVVSVDATHVKAANNNTTYANANCLGLALNASADGSNVRVLCFGTVTDPSFASLILNRPLFCDTTGYLTQTAPGAPKFWVYCAKYVGGNTVFINISPPVIQV